MNIFRLCLFGPFAFASALYAIFWVFSTVFLGQIFIPIGMAIELKIGLLTALLLWNLPIGMIVLTFYFLDKSGSDFLRRYDKFDFCLTCGFFQLVLFAGLYILYHATNISGMRWL